MPPSTPAPTRSGSASATPRWPRRRSPDTASTATGTTPCIPTSPPPTNPSQTGRPTTGPHRHRCLIPGLPDARSKTHTLTTAPRAPHQARPSAAPPPLRRDGHPHAPHSAPATPVRLRRQDPGHRLAPTAPTTPRHPGTPVYVQPHHNPPHHQRDPTTARPARHHHPARPRRPRRGGGPTRRSRPRRHHQKDQTRELIIGTP